MYSAHDNLSYMKFVGVFFIELFYLLNVSSIGLITFSVENENPAIQIKHAPMKRLWSQIIFTLLWQESNLMNSNYRAFESAK